MTVSFPQTGTTRMKISGHFILFTLFFQLIMLPQNDNKINIFT